MSSVSQGFSCLCVEGILRRHRDEREVARLDRYSEYAPRCRSGADDGVVRCQAVGLLALLLPWCCPCPGCGKARVREVALMLRRMGAEGRVFRGEKCRWLASGAWGFKVQALMVRWRLLVEAYREGRPTRTSPQVEANWDRIASAAWFQHGPSRLAGVLDFPSACQACICPCVTLPCGVIRLIVSFPSGPQWSKCL